MSTYEAAVATFNIVAPAIIGWELGNLIKRTIRRRRAKARAEAAVKAAIEAAKQR